MTRAHPWRRRLLRLAGWSTAVLAVALALMLAQAWDALGTRATGARRARMEASPQWRDGAFRNPQPLVNHFGLMVEGVFHASPYGSPTEQLVPERVDPRRFDTPPPTGLRLTWLGHATTLVELDGVRVLTDPMWSDRASPLPWVGPRRWYAPPLPLDQVPPVDAVLISHDHYDHLDMRTIRAMKTWKTVFIVPLGVGAHLEAWGIPPERIQEVDWWDEVKVGPLTITCTPARHASGRFLFDQDGTLWAGFALVGPQHRVFFSGDTGRFPALKDIGARLGPFDVTMIETGQYHPAWPDWHIGPEQAVLAHQDVRGRVMLPVHWALLTLAYHGWTEPIERVLAAARIAGVPVLTPRPGESVEPSAPQPLVHWWPTLPFETGEQSPVVSTGL